MDRRRRSSHGRPTLGDVARVAGVSAQTVSNYANGRFSEMGEETRRRVGEAMRDLGYRPNVYARGLRSSRTATIGLFIHDESARHLADPLTSLIAAGVGEAVRGHGYSLLIHSSAPGSDTGDLLLPFEEGRVDGVLLLLSGAPAMRADYIDRLRAADATFGVFDELVRDHEVISVRAADREGSRSLAQHLIETGRRRIGYLAARVPWPVVEERYGGFLDALRESDVPIDSTLHRFEGTWEADGGYQMANDLLSGPEPPDALMCGSDMLALGALRAAEERGLRVPDDLAIAGFDDFFFTGHLSTPLTTVRVPAYDMGRIAAEIVLERLAGENRLPNHVVVPTELVVRRSTAASID